MRTDEENPGQDGIAGRPLWILWIGFMSVLGSYLVVALGQGEQRASGETDLATLTLVLSVAALAGSAVSLFFMRSLLGGVPFTTYSIIRWAIADAVATFGLVLFFLGASIATFLMFLSWAGGLFVISMPLRSAQEAWSVSGKAGDRVP